MRSAPAEGCQRYDAAEAATGLRVALAFVMQAADDRPVYRAPAPPGGVYAGYVRGLRARVSHSWGRGADAMIFWTLERLCHVASVGDLGLGVTQ